MDKYLTPELLNAFLYAGLPIMVVSFVLFAWGYYTRTIIPEEDLIEDPEKQTEQLDKELEDLMSEDKKSGDFVMNKWLEFGGGYYGLMVLITFLYLEFMEILDLGAQLVGISGVEAFIKALMEFFLQLVIESFTNFIQAFLWWDHWGKQLPISEGSGFLWLGVSYAGYLMGQWLAGYFKKEQPSE